MKLFGKKKKQNHAVVVEIVHQKQCKMQKIKRKRKVSKYWVLAVQNVWK